jgi:hypothetical protein
MELELPHLWQIIKRILCNVTFSDLQVQVCARDSSGAADLSDHISSSNPLTLPDKVFPVVGIDRSKLPGMPDYNEIAVTA